MNWTPINSCQIYNDVLTDAMVEFVPFEYVMEFNEFFLNGLACFFV